MCDPWDSQEDEKMQCSIAFSFDFLIRNENIVFEEHKQMPFKIILHVGLVTRPQNWVVNIEEIMSLSNSYK